MRAATGARYVVIWLFLIFCLLTDSMQSITCGNTCINRSQGRAQDNDSRLVLNRFRHMGIEV